MIREITREHVKQWVVRHSKVNNPNKEYWSAAVTIGYDYYGKGKTIEEAYNDMTKQIMESPYIMSKLKDIIPVVLDAMEAYALQSQPLVQRVSAEEIYEKYFGTNQEMGYLPHGKEDVFKCMDEYAQSQSAAQGGMKWIISNERTPNKTGDYYAEDSVGEKTLAPFVDGKWLSDTGHPIAKWLDESPSAAQPSMGEELADEAEMALRREYPERPEGTFPSTWKDGYMTAARAYKRSSPLAQSQGIDDSSQFNTDNAGQEAMAEGVEGYLWDVVEAQLSRLVLKHGRDFGAVSFIKELKEKYYINDRIATHQQEGSWENLATQLNKHIEEGFQNDYDREDNLVPVFKKEEVIENIIFALQSKYTLTLKQ